MSNKKDIDRLFQEKFKDFEVTPNNAVWDRINESLPNKKKKRRVIALWWQIGGVAAVIALLLTVGVYVFNKTNNTMPIVDVENKEAPNSSRQSQEELNDNIKNIDTKQKEINTIDENSSKVADAGTENPTQTSKKEVNNKNSTGLVQISDDSQKIKVAHISNSDKKSKISNTENKYLDSVKNKSTTKVASNTTKNKKKPIDNASIISKKEINDLVKNKEEQTNAVVVENKKSEKDLKDLTTNDNNNDVSTIVEDVNKPSIEEAIAENSKTNNEKESDNQNRWSIAPNVAPVYFSSLGQGSPVHSQFNENSKSSDINMSYGIAGSYAISKKLKVRAGVNRVNLNYTTSDVIGFTGADAVSRGVNAQLNNVDFSSGVQSVSLISSKMINRASMPEAFNTRVAGDLDQRFGFIEVPLELEYSLLDKRFGLNFIGGFSTFFLSENEIYADVDGNTTLIGGANNINSTSFSANFGLGLDYNLSKQWNFNLEPTFKYQINTFNNTAGNFRPFFIGVYTGLSFKF